VTLSEELPNNPLAGLVDAVVNEAARRGDTSEEGISKVVTEAFDRAREVDPPEDLFDERESLSRIRDYARQHMVSPEGLLIRIILRANVSSPVHVMIPPMVGTPKPLNTAAVGVGPSGMGKTSSDDVAEAYWPAPHVPIWPLGTAEGACQAFDPDEDGQPQQEHVIFSSSEVDNWAALAERAGSMTLPVMRQIITGDQIGQKNASKAHTRIVNKRSYSAGLTLSAQPGSTGAAVLFADAPGGFPQRCLFGPEVDPGAPEETPAGIEPYRPEPPDFTPNAGTYYEIPFPASVVDEIRTHRRQVLRGDSNVNPLDGHRNLTKARVAAALMILEGRNEVTEDDWRVAERIMQVSDRTRASLAEAARQAATAANRARGHAIADRDEVVADRKMLRARKAILVWLGKHPVMAGADLRQKLKADIRDDFEAAAAELAEEGHIREIKVKNGVRYQLAAQGTGVPEGHPPNPQVNDGVPQGTGVPDATVTDLNSRRSYEKQAPKLSCLKWLTEYVDQLLAEGHTTVESFAVIEAGHAAGYTTSSIHQARTSHPDMRTISRKRGRAIWSIVPDQRPPRHESAAAWLDNWLDKQTTNTVSPDDAKLAGQAAGHPWQSVRRAAGLSPRITSVPAHGDAKTERVWHISDADGVGA
jgi:hypothetical protein